MYYFDPTYLLVIAGFLLALAAQAWVKSAYSKYGKVMTRQGQPAAQVAQQILHENGNDAVSIVPISGQLTDHYDPRSETLSLSEGVFNSPSVAALGIAAHEAGHAMQKMEGYGPLAVRSALVPVVNISSTLGIPVVIAGLVFSIRPLVTFGIILFALAVVFALVALPVEFNASKRAIRMLTAGGHITAQEEQGVRRVLNAAAMTYVAAAVGAALTLLRLVLISRRRK